MFSKELDDSVKSWILQCAAAGIFYNDLMILASPKLRLDYVNSLLAALHNEGKLTFSGDIDNEFIIYEKNK